MTMSTDLNARHSHADAPQGQSRRANVRTALTLASIAAVFFFGIIAAKLTGDASTGMSVLGTAVLLFLAVAIGRNLRR
jgi:heme A synthase